MAAETLKQTADRTAHFYLGEAGDPAANGPQNFATMMRTRKASISYLHTANDTGTLPIFRAEEDCEIIAAHVRSETGWTAAPASEDLYLVRDDGNQGNTKNVAWIDGTTQSLADDKDNEWTDTTHGLPGVYAPALTPALAGEAGYAKIPKGWWLYLSQGTNGAGATMGHVLIEITYRYL